ncbi:hypothetical protein JW933_06475 [candidate division FCPU426 bacterium]|nr:hypothetical protein [candidate division FCPU426 bacterium]
MPFCPKCGYEYRPSMSRCPDCDETLVAALPPDQGGLIETVELCKVPDEVTGMAVQAYLLEAGIDANLRDMRASFYANVLANMQGYWGTIIIAKTDEQKARQIYKEFQNAFG